MATPRTQQDWAGINSRLRSIEGRLAQAEGHAHPDPTRNRPAPAAATLPKFLMSTLTFDDDTDVIELVNEVTVTRFLKFDAAAYIDTDAFDFTGPSSTVMPTSPGTFLVGASLLLVNDDAGGTDPVHARCTVSSDTVAIFSDSSYVPDNVDFLSSPSGLSMTWEPIENSGGFYCEVRLDSPVGLADRKFLLYQGAMWGVRIGDDAFAVG